MVGAPGAVGTSPTSPGPGTVTTGGGGSAAAAAGTGTGNSSLRCVAPTGSLRARRLGPLALGMTRRRARHLLSHYSTRRKLDMDFYCQRADDGIRAFYPSPKLLRTLPRAERKRYAGKIMVALTAGPRYALHAVHAGTRLLRRGPPPAAHRTCLPRGQELLVRDPRTGPAGDCSRCAAA